MVWCVIYHFPPPQFLLTYYDLKLSLQAISPGLTRTEFYGRAVKAKDVKSESKLYYDQNKHVLEAEDVTSAVIYTLSTPPRMQVLTACCCS